MSYLTDTGTLSPLFETLKNKNFLTFEIQFGIDATLFCVYYLKQSISDLTLYPLSVRIERVTCKHKKAEYKTHSPTH